MSEEDQSGNQPQASSDGETRPSSESTPKEPQAVEPTPKPAASFGLIEASEDVPTTIFGVNTDSPPTPYPSFETHTKEAPRKSSQSVEKRDTLD